MKELSHSLGLEIIGLAWPAEVMILVITVVVLAFWNPERIADLVPALPYVGTLIAGQGGIRAFLPQLKTKLENRRIEIEKGT